jgi:hypothetical protein
MRHQRESPPLCRRIDSSTPHDQLPTDRAASRPSISRANNRLAAHARTCDAAFATEPADLLRRPQPDPARDPAEGVQGGLAVKAQDWSADLAGLARSEAEQSEPERNRRETNGCLGTGQNGNWAAAPHPQAWQRDEQRAGTGHRRRARERRLTRGRVCLSAVARVWLSAATRSARRSGRGRCRPPPFRSSFAARP